MGGVVSKPRHVATHTPSLHTIRALLPPTLTIAAGVTLNANRPAYVPPYLRARQAAEAVAPKPAAPINTAAPVPSQAGNGYRPSPTGLPTPAPTPVSSRGAYAPPRPRGEAADDGGWGGAPRGGNNRSFERGTAPGVGVWRDGQHITGPRNPRLEKELYGEEGDGTHQVSGGVRRATAMIDVVRNQIFH